MNDARKRALKRQHRNAEQTAARASLKLTEAQLRALRDRLDAETVACDHSLRATEAWARKAGLEVAVVLDGVRANGGYCDCEVLANVSPDRFGWAED